MPALPHAMGNVGVERWSLEIRALPALLPSTPYDLEFAILPPADDHALEIADGRHPVSLRGVPM
ncbi:MAG: hypothetical protein ABI811_21370 [Acidobacteriota bacterium]